MFCPNCGSEDHQKSQYCRACGMDLRTVRHGLEKPEAVMASAVSAREEIGRAIAARIREVHEAHDLKIVEDVLPEVEKFFESPEERRLRRIRSGVVTAMIGLGATLFFTLLSMKDEDVIFLPALGVIAFLIGLGIVINGLLFTITKEQKQQPKLGASTGENKTRVAANDTREELPSPSQMGLAPSVTEHTTHRLAGESVLIPKSNARRTE